MTIDEFYKKRLNYYWENNKFPKLILVSEEERNELIKETRLHREANLISNIFYRTETFELFGVIVSTQERERK